MADPFCALTPFVLQDPFCAFVRTRKKCDAFDCLCVFALLYINKYSVLILLVYIT